MKKLSLILTELYSLIITNMFLREMKLQKLLGVDAIIENQFEVSKMSTNDTLKVLYDN